MDRGLRRIAIFSYHFGVCTVNWTGRFWKSRAVSLSSTISQYDACYLGMTQIIVKDHVAYKCRSCHWIKILGTCQHETERIATATIAITNREPQNLESSELIRFHMIRVYLFKNWTKETKISNFWPVFKAKVDQEPSCFLSPLRGENTLGSGQCFLWILRDIEELQSDREEGI